jgi:hypothetical protein
MQLKKVFPIYEGLSCAAAGRMRLSGKIGFAPMAPTVSVSRHITTAASWCLVRNAM